ncbi:MAG: hypothetical protein AB7O97_16935 [Planctomycetota bacterium]
MGRVIAWGLVALLLLAAVVAAARMGAGIRVWGSLAATAAVVALGILLLDRRPPRLKRVARIASVSIDTQGNPVSEGVVIAPDVGVVRVFPSPDQGTVFCEGLTSNGFGIVSIKPTVDGFDPWFHSAKPWAAKHSAACRTDTKSWIVQVHEDSTRIHLAAHEIDRTKKWLTTTFENATFLSAKESLITLRVEGEVKSFEWKGEEFQEAAAEGRDTHQTVETDGGRPRIEVIFDTKTVQLEFDGRSEELPLPESIQPAWIVRGDASFDLESVALLWEHDGKRGCVTIDAGGATPVPIQVAHSLAEVTTFLRCGPNLLMRFTDDTLYAYYDGKQHPPTIDDGTWQGTCGCIGGKFLILARALSDPKVDEVHWGIDY